MKNRFEDRFEDDPFTAQERALLAAWDRHNARVAAGDEYDSDFEDRLIAACQAQEAASRGAGTDDEICRRLVADARTGPTYEHSLVGGFTEKKTLQQSDAGSR